MRISRALAASLALAAAAGQASGQASAPPAAPSPRADEIAARIVAVESSLTPPVVIRGAAVPRMNIAERMRFYNAPGLSIAVINNGEIEWARGYGVMRSGEATPVTAETMFAAGSISKPVAAMAALRLVQEGRLDLDQNVNERLTSWQVPANDFTRNEAVTLRRILNHTSGLPVLNGDGLPADNFTMVQALKGEPPARNPPVQVEFTPGARQRYSNAAYGLLGVLLQDVLAAPTGEAYRRTVLEPLGMSNSIYARSLPESLWPRAASGHNSRSGEPLPRNVTTSANPSLWTTPTDLARFILELHRARTTGEGRLLTRETAGLMTTPQRGGWSLGLRVDASGSTPILSHDGSLPGFTSYMVAYNARGQGAVVMVNEDLYNGMKLLNEAMFAVAHVYGWSDFGPIERATVPALTDRYADYAGTYEIDEGYPVTVVARRGKLYLIWALGSVFEMHQDGPDSFFLVRDGAPTYRFARDTEGRVTGVSRRWYGGELSAARVRLPEPNRRGRAFRLAGHPDALVVSLVGDFNGWRPQQTLCARAPTGWACRADLPQGEQRYAFLVDGRQFADPSHPGSGRSPDGEPASVVRIGG